MATNKKQDQAGNFRKSMEDKNKVEEAAASQTTTFDGETRNYALTDSPVSLLEQVKEKKRMYMDKIIELDRIENELTNSQLEERLTAIKNHYYYI